MGKQSFLIVVMLMLVSVPVSAADNLGEELFITYDCLTGDENITNASDYRIFSDSDVTEQMTPAYNVGEFIDNLDTMPINYERMVVVDALKTPYHQVVLLRFGFDTIGDGLIDLWTQGSGAMVANDVMLTAGHAVWHSSKRMYPKEVRIYIQQQDGTLSEQHYSPKSWTLATQYINNIDINYDWCVMKTQDDIGALTGYFGYGYTDKIEDKEVSLSGYPDNTTKQFYQYSATGTMNSSSSQRFTHNIDSASGQSGGPIYDSEGIIWGLHTHRGMISKHGSLITRDIYNIIESLK